MKKEWNAPTILDLTIQATEHGGKGHGHGGNSNFCRCQGGTSPCEFHHDLNTSNDVPVDTLS